MFTNIGVVFLFDVSKILSRQKDRILSVGRLEAQKNYPLLIKSFENSDIEIDIVGSGSEKQKLKNLANSLNVNLNFLGKNLHILLKKVSFFFNFLDQDLSSERTLTLIIAVRICFNNFWY